SMLGKIARKLRILGFDTINILDAEDKKILDLLIQTKRILLTSDKELFYRAKKYNCRSIFINKNTEIENLVTIFSNLEIKFIDIKLNSYRCSICNTKLKTVEDPNTIKNEVYQKVFENNTIFYRCYKCNKLYWSGSHIKNISLLIGKINKIL
ncbi:MAG TPA: Mut7-C RNAse domain-containing protein, partial [Nitrososphaeraceae archaeon]|nr:Mut7-C RNAse domain-containing protein [Nitrososphaeraceae archaeon]